MTTTTAPVIRCIAQHADCPACTTEPLRGGDQHVCDDLCDMQRLNRVNADYHRRSHEPTVHDCGQILDDKHGTNYEEIRICGWGTCVQYFCPGCDRFTSGYGPVGCKCETSPCGHGTYAEFARPSMPRKPGLIRRLWKKK